MTQEQFEALAKLLRLRTGPAREVVRQVLVDHVPVADAARAVGLEYRAAHRAVKRAKAGLDLARAVCAIPV